MTTGRQIPAGIKREVRQRCAFGCVICGKPLYEYDHLDGWAETKRHDVNRIILLCDQHHRERTSGLLPTDQAEAASKEPFNLRAGHSTRHTLHYDGTRCEIAIGNNDFTTDVLAEGKSLTALMIDNQPMVKFRVEDNHLLLTLVFNDPMNRLTLAVEDNELVYSVDPWDIEFVGRRLTLRIAERRVLADIVFGPPSRIAIERGHFLRNGVQAVVTRDGLTIENVGSPISNCSFGDCSAGILLGGCDPTLAAAYIFADIPRYHSLASLR